MASSRRTFLKQTAVVSAASLTGLNAAALSAAAFDGLHGVEAAVPGEIGGSESWYGRPMRWAQLSFVESDPGNYDLQFWLDYFKRVHAEAAILNAGGCVAFYPTQIPLHYRSKWLGNRDTFGEIYAGCRALGMNVVARTDAHACHQDVVDAHPDWIAVDADGNKRRHASDPDFWITCALGPYNFEFMTSVHEEIMRLYKPDGIFTNRWSGSGMCYCEHCRENFHAATAQNGRSLDLPRTLDPKDPARRAYLTWHQERLFEVWRLWNAKIQAIRPEASFIPNTGGGALSELDMKRVGALAPLLVADRQGRSGAMAPWMAGKSAKEFRSTMGAKAVPAITSVGLEDKYRWKDSVQNGDEIQLWMADGVAHGFRPAFTKFNARPFDKRWLPVVEKVFDWHAKNVEYFRNVRSLARVGMVYSQQTAAYYGGPDAGAKVEDHALGFYEALIEAKIPFDMVHDGLLDREHLAQFRTLILPNIAALSDEQCRQVMDFAARGGSLIATYETSLYDEGGAERADFGLAQLFGASYAGSREGPMLNSYLNLEKDADGTWHPLLNGFEDAGRIINGVHRVRVKPNGSAGFSPLTVVPTYPDLPMEEVFPRPVHEQDAGVFLRQNGQSRVVYFPWDIDRTFWEVMDVDHGKLLRNAVIWATQEPAPVFVEGKGIVDVAVWEQQSSMTVHLVNLTNPMMMKGPVREAIPLSRQKLSILVPEGRRVRRVHLLEADSEVAYRSEGRAIVLEVPQVDVHEIVAVDFAV
jgi:hypothetical protein